VWPQSHAQFGESVNSWRAGSVPALFLSLSLAMHLGLLAGFSLGDVRSTGAGALHSALSAPQIVAVSLNETSDRVPEQDNPRNAARQHDTITRGRESYASDSGSGLRDMQGMVHRKGETYFPADSLTQRPLVAVDVPPDLTLVVPGVPAQAAVLRLFINEYGDVDSVIVEDTLLPDAAQKKVTDAFSQLRFHPGEIRSVPVKSQLRIEVLLKETQVTSNEKGR
jgi:hypothetical protein